MLLARRILCRRSPAIFLMVSGCLVFLGMPRQANALPAFQDVVRSTFSIKPGGKIEAALNDCTLCHSGTPNAQHLNPFGKDLKTVLEQNHSQMLTSGYCHAIDMKDSDGDGFTNLEEFQADTLPGDPTSHPPGKPSQSPAPSTPPASAEANPFSFQAVFLAKHAQHPIFIHFPIALFVISLFFDVLGIWRRNPALSTAGYYNLVVAAVTALLAVATGLIAWQWQFGGAPLKGYLLDHLILALTTTALIWLLWFVRIRQKKEPGQPLGLVYMILGVIALFVIAITGHLGGILSGVVSP